MFSYYQFEGFLPHPLGWQDFVNDLAGTNSLPPQIQVLRASWCCVLRLSPWQSFIHLVLVVSHGAGVTRSHSLDRSEWVH